MFRNGTNDGFVDPERNSTAANPVDAESEIKNRANHRQEPDSSEPEGRGARIAFVEQRVNRGEQRGQKMKPRHQMRPEAGDCVEPVYTGNTLKEARSTQGSWRSRRLGRAI